MTRSAKITICILSAIIVLLVSLIAGYLYISYHPIIVFNTVGGYISTITFESSLIPVATSVKNEFERYMLWNHSIDLAFAEYAESGRSCDVKPYGELSNGVVRLWYKGVVTDADGNTTDYYSEGTFKLPVKAKNFKLKSE